MQSLKELYRIGRGPSSSHTIGPERAARIMKARYPAAEKFAVTLYGSLALTGKGHGTDAVLKKTFEPAACEVIFDGKTPLPSTPTRLILRPSAAAKNWRLPAFTAWAAAR